MDGLIVGKRDLESLRYTAETAYKTTEFWKEKFSNVDVEELTPEMLLSKIDSIFITPHDLYDIEKVWPTYIKNMEVFHVLSRTSGTTGKPKRIPYTIDDIKRGSRQLEAWASELMENAVVASFFPQLPSSSGFFVLGAFRYLGTKLRYVQIPIQYIQAEDLLIHELREIKPTSLFALTTSAYKLGFVLPDDIKADIQSLVIGGEPLTKELAKGILENFPNAVIVDLLGMSEDGLVGYRIVTKDRIDVPFKFPESLLVLKKTEDEYEEYYHVYVTKIMKETELTGLPIFNYKNWDLARVVNGKVMNILRSNDVISLGGAKLHIDQVMDIVHRYPFLVDFVIIYHPLSPGNPKPKAIIKVGYVGEKPSGIEDEIKSLIYEANNPVRYEVEEAKSSELVVEAVPAEKVREGLSQKPGKTKRIFIVGKDL
ncbi:coenzyme F390 synthetase [Thermococcus litoralis DSM 5473]|uniref:Coenzyme F390 synthetase n=1 Tax=Thermococcus litoralis (strain ATCC 51850 / DSM 5473 / JCM 8560 / NS-C) TaxID=523849 RepID=H3ZLU0_THELN|nr:AMP-binding protein [Thermococcus litoralis]EHR79092.1 coenzyme F390 synthetase [Thermococcus litoralis DSM 5473]